MTLIPPPAQKMLLLSFIFGALLSVGIVSLALFLTTPEAWKTAHAPWASHRCSHSSSRHCRCASYFHCARTVRAKVRVPRARELQGALQTKIHTTHSSLTIRSCPGWMPLPLQLAEREVFASCTLFGDSTFSAGSRLSTRSKFREFLATLTPVARDHAAFHAEVKEIEVAAHQVQSLSPRIQCGRPGT